MNQRQGVIQTSNQAEYLEEITWDQVRDAVITVQPELAAIIDEINPGKKLTFVRARYPYGVDIFHKGKLYVPLNTGSVVPINHHLVPKAVKQKLTYTSMPLALILDKACEVYVETSEGRTVPFKLFQPGRVVGVWGIMKPGSIRLRQGWEWSFSSGSRTMFMLPKITDTVGHSRLNQAHHLKTYLPASVYEHQPIFYGIANSQRSNSGWFTDILFFTQQWLEPLRNNLGWAQLKTFLMQEAWQQLHHWTARMVVDFNWEAFIAELSLRKMKLNNYLLDTVKHLIAIGLGTIPGFRVADDSQMTAPTSIIQKAYTDDYLLKKYKPVIMHPDFLIKENNSQTVYYSLNVPTLPEKSPEIKYLPSVMKMLRELKKLMDVYCDVSSQWSEINVTQLDSSYYDFLNDVRYDYFHLDDDIKGNDIQPISTMLAEDTALTRFPRDYVDREFPKNVQFFKGCVRVSLKPQAR